MDSLLGYKQTAELDVAKHLTKYIAQVCVCVGRHTHAHTRA